MRYAHILMAVWEERWALQEAKLQAILDACNTLKASPEKLDAVRESLGEAALSLQADFASHLKQEEEVILPAIRALLTDEQRAAMLAELRARRL
jgi:hypothetical protein